MQSFHTIVTHVRPHLDEILAIIFLRMFGELWFPGISTAKIVLWDAGPFTPNGRPASEYEKEGYVLIGVGGSRFDEHATLNEERRHGECAASLIARELGIDEDPCFAKLLEYATVNDTRGGAGRFSEKQPAESAPASKPQRYDAGAFHLAAQISAMNRRYPNDPQVVIDWVQTWLAAYTEGQMEYFGITRETYERDVRVEEIPSSKGRTLRLAHVRSDLEQLGPFSRSHLLGSNAADIFVQQRSNGQVQIFTNKRNREFTNLPDIVKMIRLKEQRAKNTVLTTGFTDLGAEGTVAGAEEWYYHLPGGSLLNGSLTSPNTPPTKLPLEVILKIITVCVNQRQFEKNHQSNCLKGQCTHQTDPCSWYDYGLQRCRNIRRLMKMPQVIPAAEIVRKPSQSAPH
ncbi:hypothetical protein KBC59_04905 [Patescibacteria group bacterium]|nr:hypothetical protein [Patescibacteria group bacterium]